MDRVYSIDEAKKWFLSHSSGSVICCKNANEEICDLYLDAETFFSR